MTTEQHSVSPKRPSLLLYDHYPELRTAVHDDLSGRDPRKQTLHYQIVFLSQCSSGWIVIVEPVTASLSLKILLFGTWFDVAQEELFVTRLLLLRMRESKESKLKLMALRVFCAAAC
jgi:hypothetical protein